MFSIILLISLFKGESFSEVTLSFLPLESILKSVAIVPVSGFITETKLLGLIPPFLPKTTSLKYLTTQEPGSSMLKTSGILSFKLLSFNFLLSILLIPIIL